MFTTIHNIRLHYHEQGDPQQPVLLLIHGLGCSLRYWSCVFDTQTFSAYRIIALDLPGFGLSEKPESYDYSLPSQADIVFEFMQSLHAREYSIVGHSMGGTVAILLAQKHAAAVRHLVVIEPNLKASDAHLSQEIIKHSESDFVKEYHTFHSTTIAKVREWFVNFQQAGIQQYIGDLSNTTPVSMYRSAYSLIAVTSDDTILTQFQRLMLPKHFLIGQETMKKRDIPKEVLSSDVHTVIVPGVGHMMMVDDPSLFIQTLAAILL